MTLKWLIKRCHGPASTASICLRGKDDCILKHVGIPYTRTENVDVMFSENESFWAIDKRAVFLNISGPEFELRECRVILFWKINHIEPSMLINRLERELPRPITINRFNDIVFFFKIFNYSKLTPVRTGFKYKFLNQVNDICLVPFLLY